MDSGVGVGASHDTPELVPGPIPDVFDVAVPVSVTLEPGRWCSRLETLLLVLLLLSRSVMMLRRGAATPCTLVAAAVSITLTMSSCCFLASLASTLACSGVASGIVHFGCHCGIRGRQ